MAKEVAMTSRPMVSELFSSVIYKPNQGRMVRQITAMTIWVVSVLGAWRFHTTVLAQFFRGEGVVNGVAAGYVAAVILGGLGMWIGFRLVNWPKFADFLISVEAELNKVSWPSWRELNRASLVVIFTIFFLAGILFLYDFIWQFLFSTLKIS